MPAWRAFEATSGTRKNSYSDCVMGCTVFVTYQQVPYVHPGIESEPMYPATLSVVPAILFK